MPRCPACSAEVPESNRFCGVCGAAIASSKSQAATVAMAPGRTPTPSSTSIDEGRFPAGAILAERYRILGLIGQGGMGEVYRANDLKLNQPVALKFLPAATTRDLLDRFHAEVRIARQVSHPNVCRVYDIGEVDGSTFLSMEYVDGEDLRSLLRRIGRLPGDKALEIARRLCAGLAAAHDKGVLHRDLKPANIMLDGRGQVLITDFGLAGLADQIEQVREGTPAYMAPEQLAGKEVSIRSDIYALGLVLHEMFTGKRRDDTATTPTSLVKDMDPAVERVILKCLEPDPQNRPASALAVATRRRQVWWPPPVTLREFRCARRSSARHGFWWDWSEWCGWERGLTLCGRFPCPTRPRSWRRKRAKCSRDWGMLLRRLTELTSSVMTPPTRPTRKTRGT
jgi:serine/threonine-protein kinase